MLHNLMGEQIALCDAGVGIGKTYAYLVACVLLRKYSMLTGRGNPLEQRPVVVSTSSIALQKAILTEYIPFLSRVLLGQGMIQSPLRAVVRKGKEHFVCDTRLEQRIEAIRHKQKNATQKEALLSLRKQYDMDTVKDLSGFDRRLVCVPKFCPRECPGRQMCRYQRYLKESRKQDVFLQICNHNYLLADAYHRAEGYKPLLSDYRTLIVDEAHKLPEAAKQMFGKNLCMADIKEMAYYLEREHQKEEARILRTVLCEALRVVGEEQRIGKGLRETFRHTTDSVVYLWEGVEMLEFLLEKLERSVPKWIRNRLEEAKDVLECFCSSEADHRAGRKGRGARMCGRVPFFLRKELSFVSAKDAGALQEREQGRGDHGGKPDPFSDLFYLRTYAGVVYFLYANGKCVPDFKRQPALSHGGSMAAFAGRNPAV